MWPIYTPMLLYMCIHMIHTYEMMTCLIDATYYGVRFTQDTAALTCHETQHRLSTLHNLLTLHTDVPQGKTSGLIAPRSCHARSLQAPSRLIATSLIGAVVGVVQCAASPQHTS